MTQAHEGQRGVEPGHLTDLSKPVPEIVLFPWQVDLSPIRLISHDDEGSSPRRRVEALAKFPKQRRPVVIDERHIDWLPCLVVNEASDSGSVTTSAASASE